jgi:hypothetical protein
MEDMASEAAITISKMLETLPEQFKDQVVEHVREYIADLKDEARWNDSFSKTQDKLVAAARQVRREIKEVKSGTLISDDEYLRAIDGLVESIQEARKESDHHGLTLDKLDW